MCADSEFQSRPAASSTLGKCDARLDVPMPEAMLEHVIALAALSGVSKAEYVRMLIERHVYGELSMLRSVAGRMGGNDGRNLG